MARMSGSTRAISNPVSFLQAELQTERRLEVVELVGDLPRELLVGPPEVTVGGGALVDGPAQVEVANDGRGAQVEDVLHGLLDAARVDGFGAERLDHDRDGPGHADGIGDLNLAALGCT